MSTIPDIYAATVYMFIYSSRNKRNLCDAMLMTPFSNIEFPQHMNSSNRGLTRGTGTLLFLSVNGDSLSVVNSLRPRHPNMCAFYTLTTLTERCRTSASSVLSPYAFPNLPSALLRPHLKHCVKACSLYLRQDVLH